MRIYELQLQLHYSHFPNYLRTLPMKFYAVNCKLVTIFVSATIIFFMQLHLPYIFWGSFQYAFAVVEIIGIIYFVYAGAVVEIFRINFCISFFGGGGGSVIILVSHYSAIGDTISCDAPYSAIGFRGKLFVRYPPC